MNNPKSLAAITEVFTNQVKDATTPEKMDALLNEQWDKPQLAFAGYNFPYKQVGGLPEDKFVLQPHPNPKP